MKNTHLIPTDDDRLRAFHKAIGHLELCAKDLLCLESQRQAFRELAEKIRSESERPKPSNFIDISGRVFGRLTVLSLSGTRKRDGRTMWLCRCECGNQKDVTGKSLRAGKTTSCGCMISDTTALRNYRHGKSKCGTLYYTWSKVKDRCYNKNSPDYKDYGARGVVVCDRWLHSFESFLDDMGEKPTPDHSIDRIDTKGNYEPENCKWSTDLEQANNTRNNHVMTLNGKSQTAAQWARELGVNPASLLDRIYRGWSVERALTTPLWGKRI